MRLVPVFTLETNNQTNNECLPKFVQRQNASSSIKTVIMRSVHIFCFSGEAVRVDKKKKKKQTKKNNFSDKHTRLLS